MVRRVFVQLVIAALVAWSAMGDACAFQPGSQPNEATIQVAPLQPGNQQQQQLGAGQINLADRANLDLRGLVRWLAEIRKMQIFDDSQLEGKTNVVKFYGNTIVTYDTMFELVQGVLRSNGLALVKADVEGFHRIVPLSDVRPYAPPGDPNGLPNAEYVTGVFVLQHISTQDVDTYLKQLVYTGNTANNSVTLIPSRNTVIVTDTASKLRSISKLIAELDVPQDEILTRIYKVQHLEVTNLEEQVKQLLNLQTQAPATNEGGTATPIPTANTIRIVSDVRTNRLILFGTNKQIKQALTAIELIDVELDIRFQRYQFEHVSAARIDELAKQSLGGVSEELIDRIYQSTINEQANELLVTTRDEIHDRIVELKNELDRPSRVSKINNPVQFYTLKNVQAIEILDTLQSIVRRIRGNRDPRRLNGITSRDGFNITGPNNLPGPLGGILTPVPYQQFNPNNPQLGDLERAIGQSEVLDGAIQQRLGQSAADDISAVVDGLSATGQLIGQLGVGQNIIPGEAHLTVDENSNTLIVVAEPAVQQLYADLIERLDRRRPQVLIEVTFVVINSNEDFQLGIEISGGGRDGLSRLFAFTSFGLSEVNPLTGALRIIPGIGFNGTLVDPDVADVVVRALYTNDRARVISAPRILVNDNATGVVSSVAEVPFTSINAANTVSSTSFAGFAEAGTTISVTPQISDDDFLNLEFDVLVNTFTGTVDAESGIPPPRASNQITSQVAIPDGHTVIVGGLTNRSLSNSFAGIPYLEKIPILRLLSSSQIEDLDESRIFVFIKPTILRDDKFRDLRFVSELERRQACLPNDTPQSEPVLIK